MKFGGNRFRTIFIFLTLSTSLSNAREVAGIEIDESIQIDSNQLVLNGSGIRSKFFFKIYVGSLYSKSKSPTLNGILNQGGPYRVAMHILYDEVSAEKLNGGWRAGFEKNLSKSDYKIIFSTNFGRDIEYYTGMVFDIWASTNKNKQEIARGGRYDNLLKSLGSKKDVSAVGAAINLNNLSRLMQ